MSPQPSVYRLQTSSMVRLHLHNTHSARPTIYFRCKTYRVHFKFENKVDTVRRQILHWHSENNAFWTTVCKTVRPMLSDRCPVCPVCLSVTLVYYCVLPWPNGWSWTDQDETWHAGRPRPWPHCVRWGPSSPPPKMSRAPIFGPCLLCPNGRPSQLLLSTC